MLLSCIKRLVSFPNPLAPGSDIQIHVSWGTPLWLDYKLGWDAWFPITTKLSFYNLEPWTEYFGIRPSYPVFIPGLQERSLRNVWVVDYLKSYNRGMPSFTVTSNVRKWSARGYNPRFFGPALKELHSITLKLVTHTISQLGSFAAERKEIQNLFFDWFFNGLWPRWSSLSIASEFSSDLATMGLYRT